MVIDGVFTPDPARGIFRWTPRCASRPPTAPGASVYGATLARPPFALDRLRELDLERLLYQGTKPGPGGNGPLLLTPLELLDRLAALVPPPRIHRHRYFGVLAPNSPLRAAVTALAVPTATAAPAPPPNPSAPAAEPAHRRAARDAWALLLARIDEVFPLRCTHGGGEMRIVAFVTDASTVRDILAHRGEPTAPPRSAPARGPPRWEAPVPARTGHAPPGDPLTQPEPVYEFDQRVAW